MFSLSRPLQFLFLLVGLSLAIGCVPVMHKRVMVMDFENATGDLQYDKLSKAIPEFIMTHMSSYPGIIFIEHQEVNLFIDENGWQQDGSLKGLRGWQALGRQLDVDYLVVGSVSKLGENFIIVSRLFSVPGGHVVPGTAVRQSCRSEEELFLRAKFIADTLRGQITGRQQQVAGGGLL